VAILAQEFGCIKVSLGLNAFTVLLDYSAVLQQAFNLRVTERNEWLGIETKN
jgi:hypothetical protein